MERVYELRYNNGLGEVLEWSNRTVLKTVVQFYCTVGSNPTLSVHAANL